MALPKPSTTLLATLLATLLTTLPTSSASASSLQRLSRAHFEFSVDLYRALIGPHSGDNTQEKNALFSPYSVTSVFSMLFLGAGSGTNTSLQLRTAMHYRNITYRDVHEAFRSVVTNFQEPYYHGVVEEANGLFHQRGLAVSDYYARALKRYYQHELVAVDFLRDEPAAREAINAWVEAGTDGLIANLVSRPLSPQTKLVLANALYFRGLWLHPFNKGLTFQQGLFYVTSQKRFEIPMMLGKMKVPVGYSSDLECRILELPFKDRRISLFVFLPDDMDKGLARFEANFTSDAVKTLFSTLKEEIVNIRLPRFRVSDSRELRGTLEHMGLLDVFNEATADFSGIFDDPQPLAISSVFHKATFEVTEEGAKGAAATSLGLERIGSFNEKYFEVDHPFVFMVWDYYSGMILFMGRVLSPSPLVE